MDEVKYSKITKDTPIEELKRIHQAIWDYVIENNRKPCTPYVSNCVACEYARTELEKEHDEAVKLLRATTPNTDAYDAQLKVVERLEYTLCVYGTNRLCKNCPIIWPNCFIDGLMRKLSFLEKGWQNEFVICLGNLKGVN